MEASLMGHDHIGVAFGDHHLVHAPDGFACQVDSVEPPSLPKDQGVGRVEVLGLLAAQRTRTESDHPPAEVADRKHQASSEPIAVASSGSLEGQSGF